MFGGYTKWWTYINSSLSEAKLLRGNFLYRIAGNFIEVLGKVIKYRIPFYGVCTISWTAVTHLRTWPTQKCLNIIRWPNKMVFFCPGISSSCDLALAKFRVYWSIDSTCRDTHLFQTSIWNFLTQIYVWSLNGSPQTS